MGEKEQKDNNEAPESARAARDLIGHPVVDRDARTIGRIADVVVELRHGSVAYLVVTRDGPGEACNEDEMAIPFGTVAWQKDDSGEGRFVTSVRAEVFES